MAVSTQKYTGSRQIAEVNSNIAVDESFVKRSKRAQDTVSTEGWVGF